MCSTRFIFVFLGADSELVARTHLSILTSLVEVVDYVLIVPMHCLATCQEQGWSCPVFVNALHYSSMMRGPAAGEVAVAKAVQDRTETTRRAVEAR